MAKASQFVASEVHHQQITQSPAPLAQENHGTTKQATLDAEALRSLQDLFLLLDEWDRTLQNQCIVSQNSSEECEITVDTETS